MKCIFSDVSVKWNTNAISFFIVFCKCKISARICKHCYRKHLFIYKNKKVSLCLQMYWIKKPFWSSKFVLKSS